MATVTSVDARNNFSDLLNRVKYGKQRLPIVRRGEAIATLVPQEDAELLSKLDMPANKIIREALMAEGVVSLDEVLRLRLNGNGGERDAHAETARDSFQSS
jgi:prevent-host-death family protein